LALFRTVDLPRMPLRAHSNGPDWPPLALFRTVGSPAYALTGTLKRSRLASVGFVSHGLVMFFPIPQRRASSPGLALFRRISPVRSGEPSRGRLGYIRCPCGPTTNDPGPAHLALFARLAGLLLPVNPQSAIRNPQSPPPAASVGFVSHDLSSSIRIPHSALRIGRSPASGWLCFAGGSVRSDAVRRFFGRLKWDG